MQKKLKLIHTFLLVLVNLFIIYICYINIFPKGYIFSGADTYQYFNFSNVLEKFFYLWSDDKAGFFLQYYSWVIFYFPLSLISELFSISSSSQSFFYFFTYLLGSFWSFYMGLHMYFKDKPDYMNKLWFILYAVIYALNSYTLYLFYWTWGFTPFSFLYVLSPILFGATYKFFTSDTFDYKTLSILGVVFFLSNLINGNLPFFIFLNILLIAFNIYWFFHSSNKKQFISKFFAYYLVFFLSVFFSVVPQLPEMLNLTEDFSAGVANSNLREWLYWQAVPFGEAFFLVSDLYVYIDQISPASILFGALFFSFIFFNVFSTKIKDRNSRNLYTGYFILLILTLFFVNKGKGIVDENTVWSMFKNPLFSAIRSYDKTMIHLPFLFLITTFFVVRENYKKYGLFLFLLLNASLISFYPLLLGEIQTKYSLAFNTNNGESYLGARYKYLHDIPDDYIEAANLINNDLEEYRILSAPYNVLNSVGWVNFTKWNLVGVDPTTQLFNKSMIQMNSFGPFGSWNFGEVWNETSAEDSDWLLNFMSFLNVKYVIYHLDVADRFIQATRDKIDRYVSKGAVHLLQKGDYIEVYKLDQSFLLPKVYTPSNDIYIQATTEDLTDLLNYPEFSNKDQYFVSAKGLNSAYESSFDYFVSQGISVEYGDQWDKGWLWPESSVSPKSPIYKLALLKESRDIKSTKTPVELLDKLIWLGSKKVEEIIKFDVTDVNNDSYKYAKDYYTLAFVYMKSISVQQDDYFLGASYWDFTAKYKHYLDKSIQYLTDFDPENPLLHDLTSLYDSYMEWLKPRIPNCFDATCYSFYVPKDSVYSLYSKKNSQAWVLHNNMKLEKGYALVSLDFSDYANLALDKVNMHEFNKLPIWAPSATYEVSFDYTSEIPFEMKLYEVTKDVYSERYSVALDPSEVCGDDLCKKSFSTTIKASSFFDVAYLYFKNFEDHVSGRDIEISNIAIKEIPSSDVFLISDKVVKSSLSPNISFSKVNPTLYKVDISNVTDDYFLVFDEAYNKGWNLYLSGSEKPSLFSTLFKQPISSGDHFRTNGYANAWFISKDTVGNDSYSLLIEYTPQRLYYVGFVISGGTLLASLFTFIWFSFKGRKA